MAETVEITYNGNTVSVEPNKETIFRCKDKTMESDLSVKTLPIMIPSGTKYITENGTYDVTEKASVNVNVPQETIEYAYIVVSSETEAENTTTIPIVNGQVIVVGV